MRGILWGLASTASITRRPAHGPGTSVDFIMLAFMPCLGVTLARTLSPQDTRIVLGGIGGVEG